MTDTGELIAARYRLVNRIATGGMGVVWEGWDELLARRVAVKQLLTQPGLSEADAMLARNRVIREARITARLHHPHAVTIYDVVDHGDSPCLIMQYVPSDSLNTVLRDRGTLAPATAGRIGADLASALQAAHAVGIVHRDVKPGNVLITGDGSAKLTDFGISHAQGDVTLTSTGMVSGTPAYLAPEVARGGESGYAADVFSLGATLYATTEGTPPFGADPNPMAVLHRVASGQMIPPKQSGPLTPLLLRMMAPDPADRPTMADVSRTLTLPQFAAPPSGTGESPAAQTLPVSLAELSAELRPVAEPAQPRTAEPGRGTGAAVGGGADAGVGGAAAIVRPATSAPSNTEPPALAALLTPLAAPPSGRERSDAPRRRAAVLLTAAVGVIAVIVAGGFLLLRGSGDDAGQAPVAATTLQQQSAAQPSPSPEEETTDEASPSTEPAPASGEPTAAELAAAVTDYYALMPVNTDAGWARLTPAFQSGIARDREYYNSFWAGVAAVEVADATGTLPGTVEATVTYRFTDGRVSVEDTAYELVPDGGVLKINNSTVLTSRSG